MALGIFCDSVSKVGPSSMLEAQGHRGLSLPKEGILNRPSLP